jgi:endoglucanase
MDDTFANNNLMTALKNYSLLIFSVTFLIFSFSCKWVFKKDTEESTTITKKGQLSINGTFVVDERGIPVVLKGMSFFWSQWEGEYYNYDCVKWLRDDWKCDVVRAAMGVEADSGYLEFPGVELEKIKRVIDAGIKLGIYVIVDWHSHFAERQTDEAVKFFSLIAEEYGEYPNIIYEIYNEPLRVSWDSVIKPYAETVIRAIRDIDPDNIIIVGTPFWSQDVDIASGNPLKADNIAYAVHFYAATHKQSLRDKCRTALDNGLCIWVSEFGTCSSDGDGEINYEEMNAWLKFMDENKISWCNWSIADKEETASALKPGADPSGGWDMDMLSESGLYIRKLLIEDRQ